MTNSVCDYPSHTFADHIPSVDIVTTDGDNKHILCACGDMYAWLGDWFMHAIAETTRATRNTGP